VVAQILPCLYFLSNLVSCCCRGSATVCQRPCLFLILHWVVEDPKNLTWVAVVVEPHLFCSLHFLSFCFCKEVFCLQLWERETERGETRRKGKEQARAEPRVAAYTNTKDGLSLSVTGPHLQHRRAEMGWFWALVLRANALAGPVVMLLYPLYASIKAIESPFKEDDQLWLTYWVLYSFVSLLELVAAPIFAWIPLWSTIKLAAAAWLVLPQFRGGTIVYEQYVRPYFYSTVQNADVKLTDTQRKFLSSISPEACNSVAQFINNNGSDAFDKIMAAVS
jgi:receptor expression-enhancing protein 5/6